MSVVKAKDLIGAGAQFGHSASRWNPKMAPYILKKSNKIHIINIRETVRGLVAAYYFIHKTVREGSQVLFVGTKRQAQEILSAHALRAGMPFVAERWLGGTLTNMETVIQRLKRLFELETMIEDGSIREHSKKMQSTINRELRKIKRNLDGLRKLDSHRLPGALFVVDPKHDRIAVREARRLGIPVVGMLDTDADPDDVDLPIPANDDALRSIDLIVGKIADACVEGTSYRQQHPEMARQQQMRERRQIEEQQGIGAISVGGRVR